MEISISWERKKKLMWRWSFFTASFIALFWLAWYLVFGQIPVVTSIKLGPDEVYQLPFSLSRLWDILIGPIWSCLIVLLINSEYIRKSDALIDSFVLGLAFGLVFGLVAGLILGLAFSVGAGVAIGLAFGLNESLAIGLTVGLAFSVGAGVAIGLGAGLGAGLAAGLAAGLTLGLAAGLTLGLVTNVIFIK